MNKLPIAACYCRLSNDDKEIGESASIDIVNTTLHIFFKIYKSAENLHSHGA
jgi:hypothetical protein